MPNLFARFVTKRNQIVQMNKVLRLTSGCFKIRKKEDCLSIMCIDGCCHEDICNMGRSILDNIFGYGQLENDSICSIKYHEEKNLFCSVTQYGRDERHFEIHPGKTELEELELFDASKTCDLIAKKLSEHSKAFRI